jgi:hypothetical protein
MARRRPLFAAVILGLAVGVTACAGTETGGSGDGGSDAGGGCTTPASCPGADTECVKRTCVDGVCGLENMPAGTVLAAQIAGDCHRNECDGAGGYVRLVDDADVPDDGNECTADGCQAGVTTFGPLPAGTACGSGQVCDGSGGCTGCVTADDCPESTNPCKVPICIDGLCDVANLANGTACDDGSVCTRTDTCQLGQCTGGNPVVCTASDQCHAAGTCDPTTGECSNPAKGDGAACSDGDSCTRTDTCQAGVCTGGNPLVSTASDPCHVAGTCDPATGLCSNPPKSNGATCSDGNACTQTDTCQAGVCTGSSPVVCTASDQCHVAGTCDPATGLCSNPPKSNGATCNDGNACTQTDTCQGGVCTGANPKVCTASDQCHDVGVCNPATGLCSNPPATNGTACEDGNLCTQTDTCQAGTCAAGTPITCTALDQCHTAGTCDSSTGNCSNPEKPYGTLCTGGYCSSGSCVPATHGTATFDYTGAAQTFTVPQGITSVTITAYGAQGMANAQGVAGGLGGQASGTLAVTPGQVLTIYVGRGGIVSAAGGYNGGGAAGTSACTGAMGGGGGGASDVRAGGAALGNRVIVGGGGGGAAGSRIATCGRGTGGGGGGGRYGGGGGAGWPYDSVTLPTGGTQSAGGSGGTTTYNAAFNGSAGALGVGGAGGGEESSYQDNPTTAGATGGAGGGTTGGNGAYVGTWTGQSGAGGSGYTGGVTGGAMSSGTRSGNGRVVITY